MSFIKVNLDEVQEQTVAPNGRYELQITSCKEQPSQNTGNPMFKITLNFAGDNNYLSMTHYLPLPTEGDSTSDFKLLSLRRFLALFNIPYSHTGIDTEQLAIEMVGAVAEVEVKQENVTGKSGEITVNRMVVPRLAAEPARR